MLDNPKSYDPRMHTAEHILNGTMNQRYKCGRSFSSHIESKKSKCDYHLPVPLTEEEIQKLEQHINIIIAQNLPVTTVLLSYDEATKEFNLQRIPKEGNETVRIVRIGNYDACPCSGDHVATTKEIGTFTIISTAYTEGVLRIRWKGE